MVVRLLLALVVVLLLTDIYLRGKVEANVYVDGFNDGAVAGYKVKCDDLFYYDKDGKLQKFPLEQE